MTLKNFFFGRAIGFIVALIIVFAVYFIVTQSKDASEPTTQVTPETTLVSKTWKWINTEYEDGKVISPDAGDTFTLKFDGVNSFDISTDCNSGGGKYTVSANLITLKDIISTKMACDNSEEKEYIEALSTANRFYFADNGNLVIDLEMDSGSMTFTY